MPPKQNRGKEHKKKEEEKPKPEKMLPDISDKKVRKPDVSRQNMGAVLPESKCSTVKVKRRKTIGRY
jgi:hypothetical protein